MAAHKSRGESLKLHAIYAVLNEVDLFLASVASIYNFVDGITVITEYDRDWTGKPVTPDGLVDTVLDRTVDPERKINLVVTAETNEARARNRAMDFASPSRRSRRVRPQHSADVSLPSIDYFWIIDADEIYEAARIPPLLDYVGHHRKPYFRVAAHTYFKSWNYRVSTLEWFTAFVRSDKRFGDRRQPFPDLLHRALSHARLAKTSMRVHGLVNIPASVGVFHHGSYVGPRPRMANKISSFSHSTQIDSSWMERVWDSWTPESRSFHPTDPSAFPSAKRLERNELPDEIGSWPWPPGYFEDNG
jgi:hypothetical protein